MITARTAIRIARGEGIFGRGVEHLHEMNPEGLIYVVHLFHRGSDGAQGTVIETQPMTARDAVDTIPMFIELTRETPGIIEIAVPVSQEEALG